MIIRFSRSVLFLSILSIGMTACDVQQEKPTDSQQGSSFSSEGRIETPIELATGKNHQGQTGNNTPSYYKFKMEKGPEFQVEIKNFPGVLKATYFGEDKSFENWSSEAEGDDPISIEGWFNVKPGVMYYFSILSVDESLPGQSYTIFIREYKH